MQQRQQHGVVALLHRYGGRLQALSVHMAADMALHKFGESLQQRLFRAVAGGRAVELAQHLEPVQRQPDGLAVAQTGGGEELPAAQIHQAAGRGGIAAVMHGSDNLLNGQQGRTEARLGFAPGRLMEKGAALPEGKEGVALHQLHQRRRLRLRGGGPLAHLLARGHDAPRLRAADAEVDRDAEAANIDATRFRQNIGPRRLKPGAHPAHGVFRSYGLVQIVRISLGAGGKRNMGKTHARSRTRMS